MPEVNLLGYQGNLGLGQGSNAQIPVFAPDENLNFVNQNLRDIMARDAAKNMREYEVKLQDRDNLNNLLLRNEVSYGKINPEYQPYFDAATKNTKEKFLAWGGDFNNTNGFREYQDSVQNLKDLTAQLQGRSAGLNQLAGERAKQTLPSKQQLYDNAIAKERQKETQKGGIWSPVDPVQQMFSASLDPFQKVAVEQVTEEVDPATGVGMRKTGYDWNSALKNGQLLSLDPEEGENVRQTIAMFEDTPPDQLQGLIQGFNNNLKRFNATKGITDPANPNYVQFKPLVADPSTGRYHINESPAEFAAKLSLATKDAFGSSTPTINKDFAKLANDNAELGLKRQKLALDAQKLGIDRAKAGAYIRSANANAKKIEDSLSAQVTTIEPQYQKFIQAIKPGGLKVSLMEKIFSGGKLTGSRKVEGRGNLDIIPVTALSASDQYINGPVVDQKGKLTVGRLEPFAPHDNKGSAYYVPRYVDPLNGSRVSLAKLPDDIEEGYKITNAKKRITKEDYLKALLSAGKLELVVEGKNGSVNYSDMLKSAKLINAQATTKGEENINPTEPESSFPTE